MMRLLLSGSSRLQSFSRPGSDMRQQPQASKGLFIPELGRMFNTKDDLTEASLPSGKTSCNLACDNVKKSFSLQTSTS